MSIQLPEHAWPKALSSTKVPTLCSVWNRSFAGAVGPQHFTLANFKRPFPFNKNRIQTFPLPFPACNVRFNGAFCPSLACGTTEIWVKAKVKAWRCDAMRSRATTLSGSCFQALQSAESSCCWFIHCTLWHNCSIWLYYDHHSCTIWLWLPVHIIQ